MQLLDRRQWVPDISASEARRIATNKLGSPKRVKTRRKRKEYLRKYRKLHEQATTDVVSSYRLNQLVFNMLVPISGKYFVCAECGKTEGSYAGLGRTIFTATPISDGEVEK